MESFLERLLKYYHLTHEEYEHLTREVSASSFGDGHHFDNIEKISEFVHKAVEQNKKIIVYGDYDADGIMATSIIVKMFSYIGYKVDYYIPNRYNDGYGLNFEFSKDIVNKGYDLVITVDNGISAFEAVSFLKQNGINVLIFDHHELQDHLPECDYFLHPTLSNFGNIASSGAFVCFMFSITFLGRFDKYLSTLASISLISDMMPLKEYNRDLLRIVISSYKEGEFVPIDLLKENEPFTEESIGMKIAPKINSIGRLIGDDSINKIVNFFVSDDNDEILNYLSWINDTNFERKELSKQVFVDGIEIDDSEESIILITEEKEGIIGLISNNLVGKYKKPCIVFTEDSTGMSYKGSCRAPEGFNVVEAFETLKDVLITFGGHALAGGCSVEKDKFENFKCRFNDYVKKHPIVKVEKEPIPLYIKDLTFENLDIVKTFSPFGESMRAPIFSLPRIKTNALTFSKDQRHILTQLGFNTKIVGFNFPKGLVQEFTYIDLIGTMKKSEYKGYITLEFHVSNIKNSE